MLYLLQNIIPQDTNLLQYIMYHFIYFIAVNNYKEFSLNRNVYGITVYIIKMMSQIYSE